MSFINESKSVTLLVQFKGQSIRAEHTLEYYDSDMLDCAEFTYDAENYECDTPLSDDDSDKLSDVLSEYLTDNYGRGLSKLQDDDEIELVYSATEDTLSRVK